MLTDPKSKYPTQRDLQLRFRNPEDANTERKSRGDVNDCLKTAVAFANSLVIDAWGVIFVPVHNDGEIESGSDLEALARTISARINRAYPPIPHEIKNYEDEPGKCCLAVLVWGSRDRPH